MDRRDFIGTATLAAGGILLSAAGYKLQAKTGKKMNKILPVITIALLLGLAITACAQNNKKKNAAMKTLVTYFSATGITEAVARNLAEVTGGTLYEIKPEVRYTAADLDWRNKASRSSVEMQDPGSRPAIVKDLEDADSYDRIFIGFPVWWYTAPTIINTFIETYGFKGKTVIFFATSGGSSIDKANADFKKQYPEINWKAGRTLNSESKAEIKAWAEGLK